MHVLGCASRVLRIYIPVGNFVDEYVTASEELLLYGVENRL